MGYYINIVTDHEILIEQFADDKSVNKELPQETLDNEYTTFVFPSNVSTITGKFFKKFFYPELIRSSSKDEFSSKYKFIFTYPNPNIDHLIDTYIDTFYWLNKK
jgi:hypothetical protein